MSVRLCKYLHQITVKLQHYMLTTATSTDTFLGLQQM